MLSRSTRHPFHIDQENPTASRGGAANHGKAAVKDNNNNAASTLSFKTPGPSRTAAAKQFGTTVIKNGAATTGNKTARVLGRKDGNQGKSAVGDEQQQQQQQVSKAGPSKPAPSRTALALLSPPQSRQNPPEQYRTPSPGVRRPVILNFSPEMDVEPEAEPQEPEIDLDQEVEYAGPSALAYEEPFEDMSLPDFRTAGFGAAMRSLPLVSCIDYDDWVRQNDEDIKSHKVTLDDDLIACVATATLEDDQPVFPLPERKALQSKSSNISNSSRQSRSVPVRGHTAGTARAQSASTAKSSAASANQAAPPRQVSTSIRRPIVPSAPRPLATRPVVASKATTSLQPRLTSGPRSAKSPSAFSSSAAFSVVNSIKAGASVRQSPGSLSSQAATSLVGSRDAERELGIFGIEDQSLGLLDEDADVSDLKLDEFRFDV
ncbi:hypothetical protein ACM66B_000396 [Microbotryomycetes sp. NB124-2]